MDIAVLLHNIRSTYNVGSIFRTADGAGVSKIWISGYTASPIEQGKVRNDIAKTALGAEKAVPWERIETPEKLIADLRREGWQIVGLEIDGRAENYASFVPHAPLLLILGNEVSGIANTLLSDCDSVIQIPMQGTKESLNVSVAAGVALFSLREKLNTKEHQQ